MRKKFICGNWKMNKTVSETKSFVTELNSRLRDQLGSKSPWTCDVCFAPSYLSLRDAQIIIKGTDIKLAAQNFHQKESGAFTGEISASMLADIGIVYSIVGHSERRQHYAETNLSVAEKVVTALAKQITPIVCIGETLDQRQSGNTNNILAEQLEPIFASGVQFSKTILAYEPVWAIGTGKTATDAEAQNAHKFIRDLIASKTSPETANSTRILYGGSVTAANAKGLMAQRDIDGALVGGASLKLDEFLQIVAAAI